MIRVSLPGLVAGVKESLPKDVRGIYGHSLDGLVTHLREVIRGEHTLDEFAEFYCLDKEDK